MHSRSERLLLAEEAATIAIGPDGAIRSGDKVRALLAATASGDLSTAARDRRVDRSRGRLDQLLSGPIADFVRGRCQELADDHLRVRSAIKGISRVSVEPVLPPDVIGLFVLVPGEI